MLRDLPRRVARWFELIAHQIFRGLDASEELWHRDGWRERIGYDPRGIAAADGAYSPDTRPRRSRAFRP